ncbi:MAG: 4Fe-4S dicluster domain-containing protein [Phycisphaerae bacterium]
MRNVEFKAYVSRLSSRQKAWSAAAVGGAVLIVAFGMFYEPDRERLTEHEFAPEMSIKQIAPKLGVTGQALARELGLPLDVPKKKPLGQLGVSQGQLDHATAHLLSHRPTMLKYYVFVALVLFGLVFLTRLGRPDGADVSQRRVCYPRAPYLLTLVVAVAVCGFVLGKSPNPMEGCVKLFKALVGLYPSVAAKAGVFVFFIALAIIGNKLICGWACPFGAMQELIYSLPILRDWKRWKLPFWLSNSIRGALLIVMFLLLFGIVGGRKGFVVYHALNPFNLFNLDFDEWLVPVTIIVSLVLSLFVYRPFCYLICPFGFFSWLAERLSLTRVRIDLAKCTKCGACIRACPSGAAKGMVEGRLFIADCTSCARCLNVCPDDLIRYGSAFSVEGEKVSG